MTAESWSTRTAHFASNVPLANQVKSSVTRVSPSRPNWMNTTQERTKEISMKPLVIHCAATSPMWRLPSPAIRAPSSGRVTIITSIALLALHHVEVFDGNGAAVAEVDDQDRKADGGLGRGDGQDQH